MEWLEVTVKTVSSAIDLLAARLTALGYDSFIIDDSRDFQSFLEENTQYWDYVDEALASRMQDVSQIRLYIENDARAPERIQSLGDQLALFRSQSRGRELGSLEITLENLREEDWENSWKQYYQPIPVGERLLIVPQWLRPENPEGRIPVVLDPGMIFGTGAHASTQMCLRALERTVSGGEAVIDLGSGSGILSIAALLLGAKTAAGVDIDPKAEDIARENAALNGLGPPAFQAVTGNVLERWDGSAVFRASAYDLVLANIVADVIIPLAPRAGQLLKPEGAFICSGVLNTRLGEVLTALKGAGLRPVSTEEQDDWCCITASLK